jgi:hypothetical protein
MRLRSNGSVRRPGGWSRVDERNGKGATERSGGVSLCVTLEAHFLY